MAKSNSEDSCGGDLQASQKKQALVTAMRLLAATPKSRKELSVKLADKGYPEQVVRDTLDNLERQGLLSDKVYAQNLTSRYIHGKPSGRRRIAFELKRHGIPAEVSEQVMEQLDPEAERERGRELAAARRLQWSKLAPEKRRKRLYDFLVRRGFEFDMVRDLVQELENSDDA